MDVIGVVYRSSGTYGDFGWMLRQPEYDDGLFVFNDNELQFRAHRRDPDDLDGPGCTAGAGNAGIRQYQCQQPPRAAGVPTGDSGGYRELNSHARSVIDEAMDVIGDLVAGGRYQRVFYSADPDDPELLGTGTFEVALDARRYIVRRLKDLEAPRPNPPT